MPPKTPQPAATAQPTGASRIQRILASIMITLIALSVIAIIIIAIINRGGMGNGHGLAQAWLVVFVFPSIALPVAFLAFIGIVVSGVLNRRRANREVGR